MSDNASTQVAFESAGTLHPEPIRTPGSVGVRVVDVFTCLRCGALVRDGWQPRHAEWHDEEHTDG